VIRRTGTIQLEHVLILPPWDFSNRRLRRSTSRSGARATRAEKIIPMARHWARGRLSATPVLLHLFSTFVSRSRSTSWRPWPAGADHDRHQRLHRFRALVRRADRVREGRALHHAVRGGRPGFAASGPLNNRFFPAVGPRSCYWLRARHHPVAAVAGSNTVHPGSIGALRSTRCCTAPCWCFSSSRSFSDGTGPVPVLGTTIGVLPAWQIWAVLGVLAVVGVARQGHLPCRPREVYASFTVAFPVRRLRRRT